MPSSNISLVRDSGTVDPDGAAAPVVMYLLHHGAGSEDYTVHLGDGVPSPVHRLQVVAGRSDLSAHRVRQRVAQALVNTRASGARPAFDVTGAEVEISTVDELIKLCGSFDNVPRPFAGRTPSAHLPDYLASQVERIAGEYRTPAVSSRASRFGRVGRVKPPRRNDMQGAFFRGVVEVNAKFSLAVVMSAVVLGVFASGLWGLG